MFMIQMRSLIEGEDVRTATEAKLIGVIALDRTKPHHLFTPASTDTLLDGEERLIWGLEKFEKWLTAWVSEPIEQTLHILLAVYAIRRLCQNQGRIAPEVKRELKVELEEHLPHCGNRLSDARFDQHLFKKASLSGNDPYAYAFDVTQWLYETWIDFFTEPLGKIFLHECFLSVISARLKNAITWFLHELEAFDPNSSWARHDGNSNPIMCALRREDWDDITMKLVKLLLHAEVHPNEVCDDDEVSDWNTTSNGSPMTPLLLVLNRGRMDMVSILIDHGADSRPNAPQHRSRDENPSAVLTRGRSDRSQ
ncbi:hypothetical protein BDW69DRAFT_180408 [Aspergillus filifer]